MSTVAKSKILTFELVNYIGKFFFKKLHFINFYSFNCCLNIIIIKKIKINNFDKNTNLLSTYISLPNEIKS